MRQYQVQLCFMSYPCWQFNRGSLDILLNIIRTSQCAPGKPIKFAAKNNSLYLINCKEKSLEFNFSDRLLGALYVLCLLLSVKLDFSCVDICVDAKRELISLALLLSRSLLFTQSLPYSCLKFYLMKSIWNKPTYNYLALIKGLSAFWKWNHGLQMACLWGALFFFFREKLKVSCFWISAIDHVCELIGYVSNRLNKTSLYTNELDMDISDGLHSIKLKKEWKKEKQCNQWTACIRENAMPL